MRPLEGIRVADFTNHAAGPFCTLMLGLLGAEVVRIESNARLDIQRRPHPVYGRLNVPKFDYLAGGKKSVTLDLKTPKGCELAQEIVTCSDVVVENFRPGVMGRLGLGWNDVRKLNPKAIMLSLSTYGQTGPDKDRPGYAPIFAAEGGLGFMTGYPDGSPGESRNAMDHQAGMMSALVVVAMLEARDRDGFGGYADVSAREVASMLVGESILAALAGAEVSRMGNDHEHWFPHGVYPVAGEDEWIAVAVRTDAEWTELVRLMGSPFWCTEDMKTVEGRRRAATVIDAALIEWLRYQVGCHIVAELQAHGISADQSMTAKDLLSDEHLRERGAVKVLEHEKHGRRTTVGSPWKFADGDVDYETWSPALGQHNNEIFKGLLGHSDAEIAKWTEEGSIR